MRSHQVLLAGLSALFLLAGGPAGAQKAVEREGFLPEPMPPGFQVVSNEIEGPVFADPNGKTLYKWPLRGLRNGDVGDRKNAPSNCTTEIYTENSGLMSPYPPGLILPDAATRKSCVDVWPAVLAGPDAKPIGKWSIIARKDGAKQWAYDGLPLYVSTLDKQPGDVLGGSHRRARGDAPGVREPISPNSNIPPAFTIAQVGSGRLLVNTAGFAVYSWDGDSPNKSNCDATCLKSWSPVLAAETSQPQGEWSIVQRSPGIRQWALRKNPLYTYIAETKPRSLSGSDEPGWHNVYTQAAPTPPAEFTRQDTHAGIVLADAHGKTIYLYACGDDALDQLACDHPDSPQEYRLSVCGGNDAARCLKTWPPVAAAKDARSPSRSWTTIDIDPLTGHFAAPGQPGAMHVWAYRGRPVYTFADEKPGDVDGDAWGEFYGARNGFKAFWLRDDFYSNAG
ncbi:MAG: COG4315 family predicted lipoprotein [Rhodospirillaceae bacterium]